ncbi:MAG: single-stranded DNA-binding protein [Candidatus Shapirobacteria bacterium]
MPSRCLNRVMLIGNLTRDPELRYTPAGMAVVSFGLATNRVWVTKQGERKEDAQFHRIVAWNKLAELCSQLLSKGRRVYVDGRIQYRDFVDQENNKKQIAEIIIDDMIILDNKGNTGDHDVSGDFGGTDLSVGSQGSPIEDIVIPDDLGEIPIVDDNKKEGEILITEEKKGDEMPF